MSVMKMWIQKVAFLLALGVAPLCFSQEEAPHADELLAAMREMTVSQGNKDVSGTIRKGRLKVPFNLSARGETMVYQYKDAAGDWQRFDVRIGSRSAELMLVQKGKAQVMNAAQYTRTIAGTDVCYEDLSLRFLYWKGGTVQANAADSRIKGRDCYVVQVPNPKPGQGQFAWVRMWVDKENGTTWQIDGYGADGKLRKRFSITSVQRLSDGTWFFKQMKLEVRNPQNPERTQALNYLEIADLPGKK